LNGAIYERELAQILSGDYDRVSRFISKSGNHSLNIRAFCDHPFLVTRSAGSQGADIIALRDDISVIIEVKSSSSRLINFSEASGKRQEQAERLSERCRRSGLILIYAYRLKSEKGDPWRLFAMDGEPQGRIRLLYNVLPKISTTRGGNYSLQWDHGLPLTQFLEYVTS
jgi:Holliday junction resolvase